MSPPSRRPLLRNGLLRQELPWLASEVLLLVVLFNANPPELWFWLVVLLVILGYRIERWWSSRSDLD
ncbi:hypothetical protein [Synechococcus sp. CS-1328]|uniref:hypothetical protein n=1 Tax=Synechococcus sp. CS-1328 TaxID=2847976 RepID=UPI00223BAC5F|nr:hypothetical protein [Synechococcus sp. CS-1328]MCT0225656.1 hypothetical protein [Synechococcus sp. CS-1328]